MLLHKSVVHDGRVLREARALAQVGHEVTVVHLPRGTDGVELPGIEVVSAASGRWDRLPALIRRPLGAARIARAARGRRPDVVHAHDVAMLPSGWAAARLARARLLYDSHEYATGMAYRGRGWALVVAAVERLLIRRCDAVITVSDGIADALRARYGLARRPSVVRNASDLVAGEPTIDLRADLGIGARPLVLHQGAAAPGRGCETLVRAVALLDDAHLLFLGAGGDYAAGLARLAAEAGVGDRVHLMAPQPLPELLAATAQADVGVSLLEPTCENHRLALPNKAFEYVAAGIPLVVSDLPELGRLVRERGIGWVVDPGDPESVAAGLRAALDAGGDPGLGERLGRARDELGWTAERERLLAVYAGLFGRPARSPEMTASS